MLLAVIKLQLFQICLAADEMCVGTILKDLDEKRRSCSCNADCSEADYLTTISGSTFPAVKYAVTCKYLIQVIQKEGK